MLIIKEPNKILRKKLERVDEITPEILDLIAKMRQTMVEAKGVGLAANQVGKDLQIFVIDKKTADENGVPDAYINPELKEFSRDTEIMEEGCLSIPRYWSPIARSKKVHLKALDENGKKIKIKARSFLARVFQHEYDHLRGILIKDYTK